MAQDVDEIVVAQDGLVAVAPFGAPLPTTPTGALGAQFKNLGYTDEEGVRFRDSKTLEPIRVWPLFYPARRIPVEKDAQALFTLVQWDAETMKFAFGGGTLTALTGATGAKYVPPDPGDIDERTLVVDWQDGAKNFRLVIVRGMVTDEVETQLFMSGSANLPVVFGIIGEDNVDPWYILTDAFVA